MLPHPIFKLRESRYIHWSTFVTNTNPHSLFIFRQYLPVLHEYSIFNTIIDKLSTNPISFPFIIDFQIVKNKKIVNLLLPDHICTFAKTPSAFRYISKRIDEIYSIYYDMFWREFCVNPLAEHILKQYQHKIEYNYVLLSANPAATDILLQNPKRIYWQYFCENTNPKAIKYISENPTKIYWDHLSKNPAAIQLIEHYFYYSDEYLQQKSNSISWKYLSSNPAAYNLIKHNLMHTYFHSIMQNQNPDICNIILDQLRLDLKQNNINYVYDVIKTTDYSIFQCQYAIDIVELYLELYIEQYIHNNHDNEGWFYLGINPHPKALNYLFTWDFIEMKKLNIQFAEELAKYVFNPVRLIRISKLYNIDFEIYMDSL